MKHDTGIIIIQSYEIRHNMILQKIDSRYLDIQPHEYLLAYQWIATRPKISFA